MRVIIMNETGPETERIIFWSIWYVLFLVYWLVSQNSRGSVIGGTSVLGLRAWFYGGREGHNSGFFRMLNMHEIREESGNCQPCLVSIQFLVMDKLIIVPLQATLYFSNKRQCCPFILKCRALETPLTYILIWFVSPPPPPPSLLVNFPPHPMHLVNILHTKDLSKKWESLKE